MDSLTYRKLAGDDAKEYMHLHLEALEAYPESFIVSKEHLDQKTEQDIHKTLNNKDSIYAGVFLNKCLVGIAGMEKERLEKTAHKGTVVGVYVSAGAQGKGVATGLLNFLLNETMQIEGLEQIRLNVSTENTAAIKLYEKMGFETYGIEKHALKVGSKYVDEHLMVLYLANLKDNRD